MAKKFTLCLVVLASILVIMTQANPFFSMGGSGGGCGGGHADPEPADEEPPVPAPVVFVVSGKPRAGKTFLATRLHTLLSAHTHWNMSAHFVTMDDLVIDTFAEAQSLDAHKLKTDAFYRYDYADALKAHAEVVKATKGGAQFWDAVRLDHIAASLDKKVQAAPKSRHVFVIDGLNDQASLTYLDKLTKSTDYLKNFPGQALNAIFVQVNAPDATREARGLNLAKPATKAAEDQAEAIVLEWTHKFDNDEQGAEGIVKMDNFLASVLLREAAN